jgi:hypothetical protein
MWKQLARPGGVCVCKQKNSWRMGKELPGTRNIVLGIIAFIGAILIVIAGLNADSIMMWLVSSGDFSFSTETPWSGNLW